MARPMGTRVPLEDGSPTPVLASALSWSSVCQHRTEPQGPPSPGGLFPFVAQKPSWALGFPCVLKCSGKLGFPPSRKVTEVTLGVRRGQAG